MKFFAIGDGHKRVSLPDRYESEMTDDGTMIFWVPGNADIPIRVSVLTLQPKDHKDDEAGFWAVISKASRDKSNLRVIGNKSVFHYRNAEQDDENIYHFFEIGMANTLVIVSLTAHRELEATPDFQMVRQEVDEMINSIEQRLENRHFTCELPESDFDEIADTLAELLPHGLSEQSWDILQASYQDSVATQDRELARRVGVVWGELLRSEVPGFDWHLTIDDWGCARSLNFEDTGVSVFPENMIIKRVVAGQHLDLKQLASDTIETVERVLREK